MRALAVVVLLAACSDTHTDPPPKTYGGDRPVALHTPATLTDGKDYPLVVILHGYSANGFAQYAYFGADRLVTSDKALVIAPDGLVDSGGKQFWNADAACCDFDKKNPDDVAYIGGLIDDISRDWPVDKNQVFLIGHSNGGFMSYRMACDRADAIAGIASLAGNASTDPSKCNPTKPVSVLQMHGTADDTVPYDGTSLGIGAVGDVMQWATKDGCTGSRTSDGMADLDSTIAGEETKKESTGGCPTGVAVDLWSLQGSSHIPILTPGAIDQIFDWLVAHKR
jgi:polyhydroxybutyrate depolymerase